MSSVMRVSFVGAALLVGSAAGAYFGHPVPAAEQRPIGSTPGKLCDPSPHDSLVDAYVHIKPSTITSGQAANMRLTGTVKDGIATPKAGNLTVEWYYNQVLIERVIKPACDDPKKVCAGAPVPFCNGLCIGKTGPVDVSDDSLVLSTHGQYQAIMQVQDESGKQLLCIDYHHGLAFNVTDQQ
jgi:hypothetical protein